jgi:hypothetical protein
MRKSEVRERGIEGDAKKSQNEKSFIIYFQFPCLLINNVVSFTLLVNLFIQLLLNYNKEVKIGHK